MKRIPFLILFLGLLVFSETVSAQIYYCPPSDEIIWSRELGKWKATAPTVPPGSWHGVLFAPDHNGEKPAISSSLSTDNTLIGTPKKHPKKYSFQCVYSISNYHVPPPAIRALSLFIDIPVAKGTICLSFVSNLGITCTPDNDLIPR